MLDIVRDEENGEETLSIDRLTRSTDSEEQKRLKEELARLTFGS